MATATAAGFRDSLDSVPEEVDGDFVTEITLCDASASHGKKLGNACHEGRASRVLRDETNVLERCWPCKRSLGTSLAGATQVSYGRGVAGKSN
jgi:hypothetical protein